MKVAGIVVEYNPFHNGHKYHIEETKKITNCDILIAIMSSNFVQRGEPSIVSKELRVKEALNNGVNLVIELPYMYTLQSADIFARFSLSILSDLGVKEIVFGAESGPTKTFEKKYLKHGFDHPTLDSFIKEYLKKGYSYPKAKGLAMLKINDFYLEHPNDILAYEYYQTIKDNNLNIRPHVIKRKTNYKNKNLDKGISAFSIRQALIEGREVNHATSMSFERSDLCFKEDYFNLLRYKIMTSSSEELREIHLVDEGIEHLFQRQIKDAISLEDLVKKCTSKRYSGARILRTLMHILLNTKKETAQKYLSNPPAYIRVLGSDQKGREYLSLVRKKTTLPLISRFDAKKYPLLLEELKATNVYFANKDIDRKLLENQKEMTNYPINS